MASSALEYLTAQREAELFMRPILAEIDRTFTRTLFEQMPLGTNRDTTFRWPVKRWPRFKAWAANTINRYWWGEPIIITIRYSDMVQVVFLPTSRMSQRLIFNSATWTGR